MNQINRFSMTFTPYGERKNGKRAKTKRYPSFVKVRRVNWASLIFGGRLKDSARKGGKNEFSN
ncbi:MULTISPECIES: hypothetical protein [Enterobacterales]|jgi:hypothetical protein|uniref:hypothetical protein n=1 Tax=Enterobacterales TaxID=91347 RepID=UPI0002D9F19A|nr:MULTISPECIES: hypothetical protein [Enterobacterales]MDY0926204.1 hypothetical protein [Enterobacter sp. CFBP8995]MRS17894.1 hypothetical protein [Enterobacteriaceae bacterium RIT692]MRT23114.1 hypothetical protein [Enterobacteriaceae bacterium RIT697]MRT42048.1 hypothetical protein [Enterobacteriaceae bacterium RIT702]KAJ9432388.1 hypothetical protein PMI39_008635 [Pantoea sp. YR343]